MTLAPSARDYQKKKLLVTFKNPWSKNIQYPLYCPDFEHRREANSDDFKWLQWFHWGFFFHCQIERLEGDRNYSMFV